MNLAQHNIELACRDIQMTLDKADTSFYIKNTFYRFLNDNRANFFDRENMQGHFTSSCFVIDPTHTKILLVHHKKVGKWLQPGGHWDEVDTCAINVFDNALKELREEAYGERAMPYKLLNNGQAYHLDIHENLKDKISHKHYDIGYLLEIDDTLPIAFRSEESHGAAWFEMQYVLDNKEQFVFSSKRLSEVILKIQNDKKLQIFNKVSSSASLRP